MARNKSFFLMMPLLGFPASFLDSAGFINSFVRHSEFPELRNHVFILCDHDKISEKNQVTYKLKNHERYVESIVWRDFNYELLIFSLEDQFASEMSKFIKGQYSHFSEQAKKRILNVFMPLNKKNKVTKNWAVLHPTSEESVEYVEELEEKIGMKLVGDFQILSKPKRAEETFKLSDLVELYEEEPIEYLHLV
ncbi:MAG: hypothetical protein ACXAAM_05555 [Candidatus Heimdallarchaeaceae archaeon]|jgi:hypothetical protein